MADDDPKELFEQFVEYKWKDVSFPTTRFDLVLRHDLAIHKYGDADGANVESTGRAPLHLTAHIPFRNGVVPAKSESWGVLYPTQFRAFMAVAAKGTTGVVQHPEFGEITCKLESVHVVWNAETRDGCDVDVVWVAHNVEGDTSDFTAEPSPISNAILGALDLDGQLGIVNPPFPTLPIYQPDFAAFMRSITAVSDQISLLSQREVGRIGSIVYRLNTLQASIERIGEPSTTVSVASIVRPSQTGHARKALMWPMLQSITQIQSATIDLQKQLGSSGRPISNYTVLKDSTLASIAQDIPSNISDLITLNPKAVAAPIVPQGTTLRYYTP